MIHKYCRAVTEMVTALFLLFTRRDALKIFLGVVQIHNRSGGSESRPYEVNANWLQRRCCS